MIVAVFAVLAVEMTVDDVIDMSAMRDSDVFAAHAVNVIERMRAARVRRITRLQIGGAEFVFVHMIAVRMVQVRVVNVIDVIAMADGEVTARMTVFVIVPIMNVRFQVLSLHSPRGGEAPAWRLPAVARARAGRSG